MESFLEFILHMPMASRLMLALVLLKPKLDPFLGHSLDVLVLVGIILYVGYVHHKEKFRIQMIDLKESFWAEDEKSKKRNVSGAIINIVNTYNSDPTHTQKITLPLMLFEWLNECYYCKKYCLADRNENGKLDIESLKESLNSGYMCKTCRELQPSK